MTLEISKDEAAIYDRQIRVWGFEAQARMKSSSVLVFGTSGLSIELMKNLVLAGVGHLIVVDKKIVQSGEIGSNFYINSADQGKLRAEVCVEKLKLLNPKVSIVAKSAFTPELLEGQHLVCHTDATLAEMLELNQLCRARGVKYISGNTYGLLGFLFFDLLTHKCKIDETIEEVTYASLEEALKTTFSVGSKKQLLRKISPSFIQNKEQRRPTQSPDDLKKLKDMLEKVVLDFFPVNEKLQKEVLASYNSSIPFYSVIPLSQGELAPCTAILGGIMAQEALKIVSAKDKPINNFFVYSGFDGEGLVHHLIP